MNSDLSLSERDQQIISACLKAAAHGPFFPDWEFETLFGLSRDEVAEIAAAWPLVDLRRQEVGRAINNALCQLTGYPHGEEKAWGRYIPVPPSAVEDLHARWRREVQELLGSSPAEAL